MDGMNRRSLITGLISLVAAPAIVRATNIMPVKVIETISMRLISEYQPIICHFAQVDVLYGYLNIEPQWLEYFNGNSNA